MKTKRKLKDTTSKSHLIKNIDKSKRKHVKVSKLSLQNEKKFSKTRTQLNEKISDSEISQSSGTLNEDVREVSLSDEKISDSETSQSSGTLNRDLREVSLSRILKAIDELSSEPDEETKAIVNCSMKMTVNSDIFWTSPTAILRAVKYSILNRNWDDITHLLLLLLQHKEQYIPLVQCICKFIGKFNPLVKKLGLQDQFELLQIKRKEVKETHD